MNIAINGLGRIGRKLTKLLQGETEIQIVAINDLMPIEMAQYLLKHDSTYGIWAKDILIEQNYLIIDNAKIVYTSLDQIHELPWKNLHIDIAIDATGKSKTKKLLEPYQSLGIKKTILSSPPESDDIPLFINSVVDFLSIQNEPILSASSCTTYSIAPIVSQIEQHFGIEFMHFSTVHCYTNDQNLQDANHRDYRRSRAAAENIVPTSTTATKVLKKIFPKLANKISASSYRVPVINGSMSELILTLSKEITESSFKNFIQNQCQTNWKGIVSYTHDPIVSKDVLGCPYASWIDMSYSEVTLPNQLKILTWYDNEEGYTHQLIELMKRMSDLK
jgi:glyceraldehyde 3-phosphate dehydrogenase